MKSKHTPPLDLAAIPDTTYLRKAQVLSIVPFSGPTLRRRILDGKFPAPVMIAERIPAWTAGAIKKWMRDIAEQRASRSVE